MKAEKLSIKTATVEIKVLRIDNHKMTKAVFRQIEEWRIPFWDDEDKMWSISQEDFAKLDIYFFGYVLDGSDLVLIYSWAGFLRKFTIPEELILTDEQFCNNDKEGREELYREHRAKRVAVRHSQGLGLDQIFIAT
jgi:hypothetical protein